MTYLVAYGIPVAFAVIAFFVLLWIDELLNLARDYRDPFTRQREEIRGLPQVPYDWDSEDAA